MARTSRETYEARVTANDDPDQRGRLKVSCGALVQEGTDLPDWIEAGAYAYTGKGDAGIFFVPDIGEVVLLEVVTDNTDDDHEGMALLVAPEIRWICCTYPSTADVPAEMRGKTYGKRMGWKSPAGQSFVFADDLKEFIFKVGKIRLGSDAAAEPLVLGDLFLTFMGSFLTQYLAHTHGTAVGPSTPPLNAAATLADKAAYVDNRAIVSDCAFTQKAKGVA